MNKRFVFTIAAALLTLPTFSSHGTANFIPGIQPDLIKQVDFAREELRNGDWPMAIARANLVAFDRPLRVHAIFHGTEAGQRTVCLQALKAGMKIWEDALKGPQYQYTDDATDADVTVSFQHDVTEGDCPVGGLVRWRRSVEIQGEEPKQRTEAEAQIRTDNPNGGLMKFEQMRHECAHELGHVLGLEDSPRSGEIMSMLDLDHPVNHASKFEIDAIERMRRLALQVKQEAVSYVASKV